MTDDRQRFETLFRAHYPAVTKYAVRRVGDQHAQEVVAETFLVAWRRLKDVPERELPWLYGTARRVIANDRRRRERVAKLAARVVGQPMPTAPDPAEGVADRLRVRAALDRLPERDREVLLLAEWEQLPAADAAHVVGCSVATYQVRLHRARHRIAQLLKADEDEEPSWPIASPLLTRGITP